MEVLTNTKLDKFLSNFEINVENNIQKCAVDALQKMDFPTTRDEYWKYTRVSKIANASLKLADKSVAELNIEEYIVSDQFIVIENGFFRADLSSFDLSKVNVHIEPIAGLKKTTANFKEIFQTINTVFSQHTLYISVPKNQVWESPVQIIYIQTKEGVMSNARLVVEAAQSSEAHVIMTYVNKNEGISFGNYYNEFFVEDNAKLTVDKVEVGSGWLLTTDNVFQSNNTTFKINTIALSGEIVRNNLNIQVEGQNCDTFLNGVVITKENQLVDNHTFVNHLVSNCMSDENYKYVLDDKSTGVFNGRVVVQKDAQKINAYQQNANILLSDFAKINAKPELEIYADDVKCSHGSTTGQLDDDAMFYLETRGISKVNAKKLLVSAFVGEVLDGIDHEALKLFVFKKLEERFGWVMV